jgi:hydrogenase expression/formation protein HypE
VLNEIADGSNVTIELQEERVPVPPVVSGACSFLGMDPLHMACEGRFVAIVPGEMADEACRAIDSVQPKAGAAVAGHVAAREKFAVVLETSVGGTRVVSVPPGELQPRIC